MNQDLLKLKIKALLHDPPEKAVILGKLSIGHEERALGLLGDTCLGEKVKQADHIASASDRINLPKDEHFTADFLKRPVIIHPLSGKEFDLRTLAQVNVQSIVASVQRAVIALHGTYGDDLEKIYLALWRELPEYLMSEKLGDSTVGSLWELLPADTRIPDHSIWEHRRITSAVVAALPDPAFLLFSIGPVQDFIATARKTHDLWAGSYMLSYLSWKAMEVLCNEFGPDSIIFPDLFRQPVVDMWLQSKGINLSRAIDNEQLSCPSLPNRFLACLPRNRAEEMARKAQEAVEAAFDEIAKSVQGGIEKEIGLDPQEWRHIWERQISGFFEFYWALTDPGLNYGEFLGRYKKLMGIGENWDFDRLLQAYQAGFAPNIGTLYGQIYRLTEKAMGSRKTVRDFLQREEPHFKCTVCGQREPLHPRTYKGNDCSDFGALRGFWQEVMVARFPLLKGSERLCAVCTTKRFAARYYFRDVLKYDIRTGFPSTSTVATASFKLKVLEKLDTPELSTKCGTFLHQMGCLFEKFPERCRGETLPMLARTAGKKDGVAGDFAHLEGDWLFQEGFPETLRDEPGDTSRELREAAQKSLGDFLGACSRLGIGSPSTYYAVILMDGDHMGKWLSGEWAPNIEQILHPDVASSLRGMDGWATLLKERRPLSPSLHLAISRALRNFSLSVVREIVERDHLGKLIYSGGDDVLAFVSLRDLLPVMRKLRAYFSGSLLRGGDTLNIDYKQGSGFVPLDKEGYPINTGSRKKPSGFVMTMGGTATASMGVVVTHHSGDLRTVLDRVRHCEKRAKNKYGRDAFCIWLDKRSGGAEEFGSKWRFENLETVPILEEWTNAFADPRGVSPRFAYDFQDGCLALPELAFESEVRRLAMRHTTQGSAVNIGDMVGRLTAFFKQAGSKESVKCLLIVSAFLGREVKE